MESFKQSRSVNKKFYSKITKIFFLVIFIILSWKLCVSQIGGFLIGLLWIWHASTFKKPNSPIE